MHSVKANHHSSMSHNSPSIHVKCPECKKSSWRVYKDYDNGYGTCSGCKVKFVKAKQLVEDEKLDRIKAELQGNYEAGILTSRRGISL